MQKILHGINNLGKELEGFSRVMLVCGGSYHKLAISKVVESIDVQFVTFSGFRPNPSYDDICEGVKLFRDERCEAILAVGGGSPMDVAKCIKLFSRMNDDIPYVEQPYEDTGIKLIAVPTTAGSGSESTRYAVIYYKGNKYSVHHDSIVPDVAILEPSVLDNLPVYQKKCTMLDALCQAIEACWSVNSTAESVKLSEAAVKEMMTWWRPYIFDYTPEAAQHVMEASNTAGRAINITQTTAAHAFSYKMTTLYGLPHGHAVAIGLPVIWQYMIDNIDATSDPRGREHLQTVFSDIANAMGCDTPERAITLFNKMFSEMDICSPKLNDTAELDILARSVNPVRLKNNPVGITTETAKKLYARIVES